MTAAWLDWEYAVDDRLCRQPCRSPVGGRPGEAGYTFRCLKSHDKARDTIEKSPPFDRLITCQSLTHIAFAFSC
jgi:hypothetical protein